MNQSTYMYEKQNVCGVAFEKHDVCGVALYGMCTRLCCNVYYKHDFHCPLIVHCKAMPDIANPVW